MLRTCIYKALRADLDISIDITVTTLACEHVNKLCKPVPMLAAARQINIDNGRSLTKAEFKIIPTVPKKIVFIVLKLSEIGINYGAWIHVHVINIGSPWQRKITYDFWESGKPILKLSGIIRP